MEKGFVQKEGGIRGMPPQIILIGRTQLREGPKRRSPEAQPYGWLGGSVASGTAVGTGASVASVPKP